MREEATLLLAKPSSSSHAIPPSPLQCASRSRFCRCRVLSLLLHCTATAWSGRGSRQTDECDSPEEVAFAGARDRDEQVFRHGWHRNDELGLVVALDGPDVGQPERAQSIIPSPSRKKWEEKRARRGSPRLDSP